MIFELVSVTLMAVAGEQQLEPRGCDIAEDRCLMQHALAAVRSGSAVEIGYIIDEIGSQLELPQGHAGVSRSAIVTRRTLRGELRIRTGDTWGALIDLLWSAAVDTNRDRRCISAWQALHLLGGAKPKDFKEGGLLALSPRPRVASGDPIATPSQIVIAAAQQPIQIMRVECAGGLDAAVALSAIVQVYLVNGQPCRAKELILEEGGQALAPGLRITSRACEQQRGGSGSAKE